MKENSTIKFYNKHAKELINQYDNAKVEQLHILFSKYIKKDDTVLDIGFGSGRDLKEIKKITSNVFGLDACKKFIENVEHDSVLKGQVAKSVLPDIIIDKFKVNITRFDVIVSIAVLMHLSIVEIVQTIEKMKSILTKNGIVIISYSLERRSVDERHFESLSREIMIDIFRRLGFSEIDKFQNNDGMNRDIKWVTQVYRLNKIQLQK